MGTISNEYIGCLEDRIARNITARDQVQYMRTLYEVLLKKKKIDVGMYEDARDSLSYIDGALLDGKQAIAMLRNARRRDDDSSSNSHS